MKKIIHVMVSILVTFYLGSISQASEVKKHEEHAIEEATKLHLSHELKVLLNQEMNEIEGGMMKIIPAISAGDWGTIANTAKKIKDSFILKQKITQKQLEELHNSLPSQFIEMDQLFHATAGKLSHAAQQHDGELINFYFYKLHSKCITCHSKYASERFPNLNKIQQKKDDQH